MEIDPSPGGRGLPPHTPTGLRGKRHSTQLGKARQPPFQQATGNEGPHNTSPLQNGLKRRHSSGHEPWRGGKLIDWMTTKDGQPLTEKGRQNLRDQREEDVLIENFSSYPGDDEDGMGEIQLGNRPPKRRRADVNPHNSRRGSDRGGHTR